MGNRWWGLLAAATIACGGEGAGEAGRPAAPPAQSSDTAPAGATTADRTADEDPRPAVVILGTSLTAGLGVDLSEAYPAVLQRLADSAGFGLRIVNAGLSGETSAGALRRVGWTLRSAPALLIIETGANDGLRGLDPDSTAANLLGIIDTVRTRFPGTPIALVQMEALPNLGPDYTARFRAVYPAVARRTGVAVLPFLLQEVGGRSALNQSDGIHPNPAGAEVAARTLWPALVPLLRQVAPGA
jgi:acyl-CoA thioesterase I